MVDLPSKGRYYKPDHPCYQKSSIEVKYMTTAEEDILLNKSFLKKGVTIEKLIAALIVDRSIDPETLLSGDRNAITYAIRKMGYGSIYDAKVPCESCGEKVQYSFDLDKVSLYEANESEWPEKLTKTEQNTFLVPLPRSGFTVEFRLLSGKHEKYLTELAESKKFKNLPETPLTDQLQAAIISVNGVKDRTEINKFIESMPAIDSKYLRMCFKKVTPNVDFTHEFKCSECGFHGIITIPLTTEFFWPR